MDRPSRQILKKEILQQTDDMTQMDITDIYRTYHPNTKEYSLFSALHRTFSTINHILDHKANFNRYKNKLE